MAARKTKSKTQNTVDVGTLAALFNLTERRVQQLAQEGVIPKASRGRYPLIECAKAYIVDLQTKLGQGGKIVDIKEAERRLKTAQAELKERELDVLDGKLIPAPQVQLAWSQVLHEVRSAFMSLPDDVATGLHDCETLAEKTTLIREAVEAALSSISEAEVEVAADPTTGAPGTRKSRASRASTAAATAETHSQSVG